MEQQNQDEIRACQDQIQHHPTDVTKTILRALGARSVQN